MELLKQDGPFCMIYAAAMLLDIPPLQVINFLGHDGTEIKFPKEEGSKRFRGIHIQEIIDLAWARGFALVQIELFPVIAPNRNTKPEVIWTKASSTRRFEEYLALFDALLYCKTAMNAIEHMCAWNHIENLVYDPNGVVKELKQYVVGAAWIKVPK